MQLKEGIIRADIPRSGDPDRRNSRKFKILGIFSGISGLS